MVTAPDKIADWVVILKEWRLANCAAHDIDPRGFTVPRRKVGRNEPCLCGSARNTRNVARSIDRRGARRRVTAQPYVVDKNDSMKTRNLRR